MLAIDASLLLEDADRAQSLFMAAPEGEANPAEASDSSVRKAAALALLHIGQLSRAHALIGDTGSCDRLVVEYRIHYGLRMAYRGTFKCYTSLVAVKPFRGLLR